MTMGRVDGGFVIPIPISISAPIPGSKILIDEFGDFSNSNILLSINMVRDLCLSKAKEEKFFEDSQGKIRRLAINLGYDDECSIAQFKNANLRSLLLLSDWRHDFFDITNIWQNLLSNALLRYLKVLVLKYCKFKDKKLPHSVRKLVMLKHLSIRHSNVVDMPEFVCKLPCLQSLDLRVRSDITLPNSIEKMGRLRHLFLSQETRTIDGGRLRLDGLTELETFIGFDSEVFYSNHLLKLTNLRCFDGSVTDIESLSVVVDHIINLKDQLRETSLGIYDMDLNSEQGSLVIDSLMHCPLYRLKIFGRLRRLPTWDPQLPNLSYLSIEDCPKLKMIPQGINFHGFCHKADHWTHAQEFHGEVEKRRRRLPQNLSYTIPSFGR